jgi:uncharacterized protein (DUF427 family)
MQQNVQAEAKPIKLPGPDHPISVERNSSRIVVSVAGRVVADTREALTLSEAHYPPVQYIPLKDVDRTLLARSDRTTYCPYKGDAAYFSIPVGGERSIDACGRTRRLTRPSPASRIMWPSTRTGSMRSKSDHERPRPPPLNAKAATKVSRGGRRKLGRGSGRSSAFAPWTTRGGSPAKPSR